jgi:hypothetical protein
LSVAEGQQALEPQRSDVTIAPDETQVEFTLTYALGSPRGPLSARLHTFPAAPRPLAMVATFEPAGDRPRTFTVAGAPERVILEPAVSTVARTFGAHGGRLLLDNIDGLLMLVCLVVAIGSRASLRAAVAALAVAHAAGFLVRAGTLLPMAGAPSQIAGAIAASAVVAAAAALVVGARPAVFVVLALVFGGLNGASLGEQLRLHSAAAGAHPAVAVAAAVAVTTVGQIWVVAILATVLGILRARGLSDRLLRYAAAAWTGHTALHLVADRTIVPEGMESQLFTRLETLILLCWTVSLVLVAAARALRGRALPGRP